MLDGFCQVLSVQWGEFATLKHWFIVLKWCGCLSVKSKGSNRTSGCTGSMVAALLQCDGQLRCWQCDGRLRC